MNAFDAWFSNLTNHPAPRDWQANLAAEESPRSRLIRISTGLGKTEGVLSTWSYHRCQRNHDAWPRRLVWCLPMRVLVEQTQVAAQSLVDRMPIEMRPKVYVAMGGEEAGEWFCHPEKPAIIIGTQDMLLSRSLNRGYASSRARWPIEFGLLNHDALWVMDEVQLMDVGLATSAQLQAFRHEDSEKAIRPCWTWWMSATLQTSWLKSVDTYPVHEAWIRDPCVVPASKRQGGLFDIEKSIQFATYGIATKDIKELAEFVLMNHNAQSPNEFGKITLVVCNTVKRACETFDALQSVGRTEGIELVHSRVS